MTNHSQNTQVKSTLKYTGISVYSLTILTAVILLITEPAGFDAKALIIPTVLLLFLGALGFSYPIASKNATESMSWLGTLLLAVMFAFIGFFIIAGVAWVIAASHV